MTPALGGPEVPSMDPAYYVAAGSLKARSMQLDALSNNLANLSTVGYKAERTFLSVYNKARGGGAGEPLSRYVNDGTVMAQSGLDFGQGASQTTGRSLDMAIEGNAFFAVQTPQGVRLTRDGRFQMGTGGQLVTADGAPVLGKNGQPLKLDPAAGELTVTPDGTLKQGETVVGQFDLRAYADLNALTRSSAGRYDPGATATAAVKASVSQGHLEQSGVDMSSAMVEMIRINRLFEMSLKVASTLSNDLDARTINDVANQR
jgi:flagellar basal-body rod protein FlgF